MQLKLQQCFSFALMFMFCSLFWQPYPEISLLFQLEQLLSNWLPLPLHRKLKDSPGVQAGIPSDQNQIYNSLLVQWNIIVSIMQTECSTVPHHTNYKLQFKPKKTSLPPRSLNPLWILPFDWGSVESCFCSQMPPWPPCLLRLSAEPEFTWRTASANILQRFRSTQVLN